jgi:hypothetical protein
LEPVSLALIAAGHFSAGVTEMFLNVGLFDLSRGGEAGAKRMAAEREAALALGKVAAQAGGEGASLHEPHDVLVSQPLLRNPAVLAGDRPEEGTVVDPAEPQPSFEKGYRAGVSARAAADFDLAPTGLAADGQERTFRKEFDPARTVVGLAGPAIEADDFGAAEAAGEADRQDRPVAKAAQIHLQGRQHGQELIGEDRSFLCGRAAMAAADAGQHGGDMAIADLQRLTELAVAPGDSGQAPLEGGDRKLRAAAFDLGSQVEADRFRVGRRFGESLAAQPRGEHFPVRGVGALSVIRLSGPGVVFGSLRERRKAAAEACGGREQGRGVGAWSLGLERHALRLSAIPGAFVKTALRVGRRASADRGGAARGAAPGGPGGGAWPGDLVPPGLRDLGVMWRPGLRCPADQGDAIQFRRGLRCSRAGELGRGRGESLRQVGLRPGAIRRHGVVLGISGSAPLRARWSKGLRCGRLQVLAKPGVEARPPLNRRSCFRRLDWVERDLRSGLVVGQEGFKAWFCVVCHGVWVGSESRPIMQPYRTSPYPDKRGGLCATQRDKAPRKTHHARVIRTEFELLADRTPNPLERAPASLRQPRRTKRTSTKTPEQQAPPPPSPIPAWARASGGEGQGEPLFSAGAALALLDAFLRADPPASGALRARLALQSAAASAKILRLNTDAAALRDLRFAVGDPLGSAANLLSLWRDGAGRPPSLDPDRIFDAAARLGLALPDANGLAASLKACAGEGDPVSAAAKAAALAFSAIPDALAPPSEILALWAFDITLATRLRWPRPVPLIAVKILDPTLRSPSAGRRPAPNDPAWRNAAAGAIALAAASALDLAADLARRSNILLAVAPKLRSKPAQKIVDLMLAQDCVSPAEATRHAPMTGRAARRLFDRLVALGAAREFSGRPTFRLYGL